jgi:hypothetical protein
MGVELHGPATLRTRKRLPIASRIKGCVCLTDGLDVLAKKKNLFSYHKSCSTVTIFTDLTRLLILA